MDYDEITKAIEDAQLTWIGGILVKAVEVAVRRKVFVSNEALLKVVGKVIANNGSEPVEPYWQPMETAPKDGTKILLLEDGKVYA